MPDVASQTFEFVSRELNATLAEARTALETYVEQPENLSLLGRCADELHQVQGVLRVLEIYGAALLAEEMEQVTRYLVGTASERKNQAEGLDAVMRAMVQLPSYLERVLAGGRDLALVLLPLLNDLRAVRGSALLSEGTLLLLNLKSDRDAQPVAPAPGEPLLTVEQWARRLRARFQVGLIGWIRGERLDQNLEILATVAHKLEQVATRQPVFQLWWVGGAVIEALRENGVEGGVSVKRLLGLADREIKRLYEQGEARYCQNPPVELLNNLLYYVARAESGGPRVAAVRASFRLGELLPVDETIEQERESLSAPSVKLMQTVGAAIREDLSKVKDVLDIFVRGGGGQPDLLEPQVELLRKIGDTLGVLGLGELRSRVQEECVRLQEIVARRIPADEATLVQVATTLIGIEDGLEEQLVGMILPRKTAARGGPAPDGEFQQVQSAVLRECILNLTRVKEAIAQSVGGTLDAAGLDSWNDLMRGLEAGLLMLGKARAVEIAEGVATRLKDVMQPGGAVLPPGHLDRLADAIVSLEYYMETLQAGRADPWYMLDNAEACLQALAQPAERVVPTVPPVDVGTFAATQVIAPPRTVTEADLEATDAPLAGDPPTLVPGEVQQQLAESADPELVALFIEEAREEVARIQRLFPQWEQNPLDAGALVDARRAFHTLKGSGRMVGARDLSEFAWAAENLLNRLIDRTLTRGPAVVATLRDAVKALPELIAQLESGSQPPTDVAAIVTRAHALAAGRTPDAVIAPEDDAALREIYAREARANIATVRAFIAAERAKPAPHVVAEEVYRACHTLSGSSKMAEARHGVRLAEPLDRWLRKSWDSGVGLADPDLGLLGDCMNALEAVALHLDETTGFFLTHETLVACIARAESELDAHILEAAQSASEAQDAAAGAEDGNGAAEAVEFDPEIAGIFCEEATELIDSAEAALREWNEDRGSAERLAALKRSLHTLKGGARMAGVWPMGDLSHELETLIIQIGSGAIPVDDRAYTAAQESLDELARMRESVASGRPVAPARALVRRLQALAGGRPEPAPAVAPPAAAPRVASPPAPQVAPQPAQQVAPQVASQPVPARPAPAPAPAPVPPSVAQAPAPPPMPRPASVIELPVREPAAARPLAIVQTARAEDAAPAAVLPPGREPAAPAERAEMARVDADLLDQLLNNAGEVSIGRARLEQQLGLVDFNLGELSRTVTRLKEQLRKLEIETETQILHRHEQDPGHRAEFDPLELDRYSTIQQFSRALAETASDVASLQQLLETLTKEAQNTLQQQSRTITEMQNGLLRTRMVPFQRHVQRLARIVRQAASDTDKKAELVVEGASGELDRQVLERMLPPFEHMLRNAVVHGLESPEERRARGKDETGRITLGLRREGAEVIVQVADDGAGMNLEAIRAKALALGLLGPDQIISDEDAMQLVLEPGFSTAGQVTHQAGRGVGMDVVATEVKKLGGALHIATKPGEGTEFTIRLPFTLAISHALIVRTGDEHYALPLTTVEGVVRLSKSEVAAHLGPDAPPFDYGGQKYRFQPLAIFVGLPPAPLPEGDVTIPVVLVRAGDHSTGLVADELVGSREIVVKSVGAQVSSIRGISGATILGDGRIVVILDIAALLRAEWRGRVQSGAPRERGDKRVFALVVDDSITVRRVTQRLLERNGMRVVTARDGMDAVSILQDCVPDIILLDIEMPRMDGYEVAAHVRNDPRLASVPIIMITSRTGEKHRARAIELGVDDYLGKPYQEAQLLEAIEPLVARRRRELAERTGSVRLEGQA